MGEPSIRDEGDWSEGQHGTYEGLFTSDMNFTRGGLVTDMPALGKPVYHPPAIKGVPGASITEDPDHQPGGGNWRDV